MGRAARERARGGKGAEPGGERLGRCGPCGVNWAKKREKPGWVLERVLGWALFYFFLLFLFYSYFKPNSNHLNSNLTLNSNHTQSVKSMHQHELHKHVDPKITFNYLCNEIRLNAS